MNDLILTHNHTHSALQAIGLADLADGTKRKYETAVLRFADGGRRKLTDRAELAGYAVNLSHSGRAHLKAAVRLWTNAMINDVKAVATPDNLAQVDAAIHRLQALQTAVTVKSAKGEKVHTWLSLAEVMQLTAAAVGDGAMRRRDLLSLGLLVGAGLRREEAINLTFDNVKLQPVKGKMRSVLQVTGKGSKDRAVPISDKLAGMIDAWSGVVGGGGAILRSIDRHGRIGQSLSAVAIFHIVRKYGTMIGHADLAPHDLRRTFAQIGFEAGVPITQISKLLGHATLATTQRYLNLDLDLVITISDFVPL